jgi:hypothetical protein
MGAILLGTSNSPLFVIVKLAQCHPCSFVIWQLATR